MTEVVGCLSEISLTCVTHSVLHSDGFLAGRQHPEAGPATTVASQRLVTKLSGGHMHAHVQFQVAHMTFFQHCFHVEPSCI